MTMQADHTASSSPTKGNNILERNYSIRRVGLDHHLADCHGATGTARFESGDVDGTLRYQPHPDVARYLYRPPWTPEEAPGRIASRATIAFTGESDSIALAVVRRDAPGVIGEATLTWTSKLAMQAEIGWIFNPEFSDKGYATEAARALLDAAFSEIGFHRVFARLDAENVASANVSRRLGMRQEALLVESDMRLSALDGEGVFGSEMVFAILRREWEASR